MALQAAPALRRPRIDRLSGRVVVGLSGGVDSSVTAALLQEAGFDVIGMTMQIWHRSSANQVATASSGCCTVDAVDDARRVAHALGIPYYVPNFRQPFSVVVDDFAEQYAAGRTPNPCVKCNQLVRFDGLLQKADELGAEYVATGHYARVGFDEARKEFVLEKACDSSKDQSYVLYRLKQRQLSRLITPLGELTKQETRNLAGEFGLPVAAKPDSQEICFVAGGNYREFLREVSGVEEAPGPILDTDGTEVGRHTGIHNFTVGQRKGLHLGGPEPSFVIELRPADHAVIVGRRHDAEASRIEVEDLHYIGHLEAAVFDARVRVRSHAAEVAGQVTTGTKVAMVEFEHPVWGAAPGQSAVFYHGDRVIGGGTISRIGA